MKPNATHTLIYNIYSYFSHVSFSIVSFPSDSQRIKKIPSHFKWKCPTQTQYKTLWFLYLTNRKIHFCCCWKHMIFIEISRKFNCIRLFLKFLNSANFIEITFMSRWIFNWATKSRITENSLHIMLNGNFDIIRMKKNSVFFPLTSYTIYTLFTVFYVIFICTFEPNDPRNVRFF